MGNNHSHILSNNLLGEVLNLFDKSQRKRFLWQFASSELLGKIWVGKAKYGNWEQGFQGAVFKDGSPWL